MSWPLISAPAPAVAIILARQGVKQLVATDLNPRALACAADNLQRLALNSVQLEQADLFPKDQGVSELNCCQPTGCGPAQLASGIRMYDPKSSMLRGFLKGVRQHLAAQGEVWLILSDLANTCNARREELLNWFLNRG